MTSAVALSTSNEFVFIALEDVDGLPQIIKSDLLTSVAVYVPGVGTAANVIQAPDDNMLFFGNFGSGVGVILHTISTAANVNISPAGLGSNVVNAAWVNPENGLEIWIAVSGLQDLMKTIDAGANWVTVNSSLGIDATVLVVFGTNKVMVAGNTGSETRLLYSSDNGVTFTDISGSPIHSLGNILAIEVI